MDPELGSALGTGCPGGGGQGSRVCLGLRRGAQAAVCEAGCRLVLGSGNATSSSPKGDLWLNTMPWPHLFISAPFLITPPPMALKKMTEPDAQGQGEQGRSREQVGGASKGVEAGVYGWTAAH